MNNSNFNAETTGDLSGAKKTFDQSYGAPNIPLSPATSYAKNFFAKADNGNTSLDYLAFPSLAEVEDGKIAVAYKRGYSHASDYSDLEVTYADKATSEITSKTIIASSTTVRYQNPELITMPNGDTYCYTDIQNKDASVKRLGITIHKYNKETVMWDYVTDQLYDDKGIQYGYVFDGICDGNRLYMLAMTFPELANQDYGSSVHIIYTDDNGSTYKFLTSLTDLLGVSINESGFILHKDRFIIITRADNKQVYIYSIDKKGNLINSINLTDKHRNIWVAARPRLFTYNNRYYFTARNIPNIKQNNYQEYTLFEFNPDTLDVIKGTILDTRNGSGGDAYYGEHYINEKEGKKYIHFIIHATSFTSKPSIEDHVFVFDDVIEPNSDTE